MKFTVTERFRYKPYSIRSSEYIVEHLIFIDESGNAGANLMDAQPIFTLAAVGLERTRLAEIESRFHDLKARYGFQVGQVLKGSRIIKNRNNKLLEESVRLLLGEGASLFASVIERRFMLAGLVVENLFDPFYNSKVDWSWTHPIKIKTAIANHLYSNLSTTSYRLTANAFILGNYDDMLKLVTKIERELMDEPEVDGINILELIDGVGPNLEDMANTIKSVHSSTTVLPLRYTSGGMQAPNTTGFVELIMRIENSYAASPESEVTLVFYSAKHFDQTFEDLVSTFKDTGPAKYLFPGKTPMVFGFEAIKGFRAEDAGAYPLLECADYVATGIRSVFELALKSKKPAKINDALHLFLGLLAQGFEFETMMNLVISDRLFRDYFDTLMMYAPDV